VWASDSALKVIKNPILPKKWAVGHPHASTDMPVESLGGKMNQGSKIGMRWAVPVPCQEKYALLRRYSVALRAYNIKLRDYAVSISAGSDRSEIRKAAEQSRAECYVMWKFYSGHRIEHGC